MEQNNSVNSGRQNANRQGDNRQIENKQGSSKQDRNRSEKGRSRNKNWKNFRKGRNKKSKLPPVVCALCEKNIDSVSQALCGSEKDQFVHFDCVLRQLAESESVKPGQKISYIGNGEFAVIEYKNKNYSGGFTIVKRISYEDADMKSAVKKMVSERKRTARV